jgi:alkaline phosphatase
MMKSFRIFLLLLLFFQFASAQQLPKNVIIMIGDGMGFEHVDVSLYYQGIQDANVWGEFPVQYAIATFFAGMSYDSKKAWSDMDYVRRVHTESAAAATAIATGQKTAPNHVGVNTADKPLFNIVHLAKGNNKSAGIVTSVPFNHATPAGFLAHHPVRTAYGEIAIDMLLNSSADVVMGCGHPLFDHDGKRKPDADYKYVQDENVWNQILVMDTVFIINGMEYVVQDINADGKADAWTFADHKRYITDILTGKENPERLLFIAPVFETLSQMRTGLNGNTEGVVPGPFDVEINAHIPTLEEMTAAALKLLSQNESGFFLMVEGGAIDWAGHDNDLVRLIEEQMLFENTVKYVIQWISDQDIWDETLLIVLADHECGYLTGSDNLSEGFVHVSERGKGVLPEAYFHSGDHTNHLVPFLAKGAGSAVFSRYARNEDSVRGNYLHLVNVFHAVSSFWEPAAVIYPGHLAACKGSEVSFQVLSNLHESECLCYLDGQPIQGDKRFYSFLPEVDSEVYCILKNGNRKITTKPVKVRTHQCKEEK